jgi:ubiquinone/menaquinone biosynthesis C-methylase UbiE
VKDVLEKTAAKHGKLLDVGGASGDLAGYLFETLSPSEQHLLEYDPELVDLAKKFYPNILPTQGTAEDMTSYENGAFDAVTMVGVMSIFDDFTLSLGECIRVANQAGVVVIVGQFNDWPLDALMKWRYSGDDGPYHQGYNLFSKKTVSSYLSKHVRVASYEFVDFQLSFDLAPSEDPVRLWTYFDKDGKRKFRNGLMDINLKILTIKLK